MLFKKESILDKLIKEQAKLIVAKQRTIDLRNRTNSLLETKIQSLENRAFINKQNSDNKIEELERKFDRNKKQIALEKDYYNSIGNDKISI